jgi:16S rRNA (cytosine967-C5)-methyltransferase
LLKTLLETLLDALPRAQEHRLAGRAHVGLLLRVGLELVAIGLGGKPGADPAMARHVRSQRSLGSHDRRLVADLAYGVVRERRLLERLLALAGTEKPTQVDLWRANLALCHGSYPEGLDMPDSLRNPREALKTWAAQESPGQEQLLAELGSLPDWLAAALLDQHGEEAAVIASSLRQRAPTTLRANRARADRDTLASALLEAGVSTRPGVLSEDALHLEGRANLQGLAAWRQGWFEMQDEGSQVVAALVSPPRESRIVDFCAGAGGKSLALAHRLPRGARILGLDPRQGSIDEARHRAKRAGARHLEFRVQSPEEPLCVMPGSVDRVLVDAPCTGTGRLRRQPAARWSMSAEQAANLVNLQSEILDRAATLVRPGGWLIYATCSLLSAENETQVESFLTRHKGWDIMPARDVLKQNQATQAGDGTTLQLRPDLHGCDGFFGAILVRAGEDDRAVPGPGAPGSPAGAGGGGHGGMGESDSR